MQTNAGRLNRRARSSHVRERVLIRIPSTVSTSPSNARTVCPSTPLRRTSGSARALLRCSSSESDSQGGNIRHRSLAAVTWEIQAPGDAAANARAAASSSKSQSVGR